MNCMTISNWVQENLSEYRYLSPGFFKDSGARESTICGFGIDAGSCEEVEQAAALRITAERIYFSVLDKTEPDIRRVLGKCKLVANDLEELRRINQVAQSSAKPGFLESVGLRVIPDAYKDGNLPGIPERDLPALAQAVKGLPALSIGGCFVQGNLDNLHGAALGKYFRACYEVAKRVTVILPCGMPYLCVTGGAQAAFQNAQEHPETLEDCLRAAKIVAAQNQTAFYSRLLIT